MQQAADSIDGLRSTIVSVGNRIGQLASRLTTDADALEGDTFSVDDGNWHVKDLIDYEYMKAMSAAETKSGDPDPAIDLLKKERANEAANETLRLQGLARDLGEADQRGAAALKQALGTVARMIPIIAGIYPGAGAEDFKAIAEGTATPAQIARAGRAMNLTDQQLADLNAGRPVSLSPEQATYVREFLSSQKNMSLSDLSAFGEKLPGALRDQAKGVLADSLQLGSNPNISGNGYDGTTFQGESRRSRGRYRTSLSVIMRRS